MKEFEADNQNPTRTAFVTFGSNYEKNIFLSYNTNDIAAKLRYYLKCCSGSGNFFLKDSSGEYV